MHKTFLLVSLILCSLVGFMVKLPRPFRNIGFELHAAFYFFASIFLLFLFPKKHILVLAGLIGFGIMIECFQEASNYILDKKIHGNFDPKDIKHNFYGILLVFVPFYIFKFLKSISK